ncbi:MAG: prolyl oligopeptidase family serine peptidase [Caldithrix sp.]|nr:prolyl oligopeptidase family serine peptidase [Caldithrix sp.]
MTTYRFYATLLLSIVLSVSLFAGDVQKRELGNLVLENIPEIPEQIKDRLMQYQNVRGASFRDWQPDGQGIMISTRFGETSQFHLVEDPLGMRKQITFFEEPVGGGAFCPHDECNGFLFNKDIGGSEFSQIFYFDVNTGNYNMLTDGQSRNGAANWSNKGDRFSFYSTKRNGRDWDVYVASMDDPENPRRVLEKGGVWVAVDWSPDDSKLLVINYISANISYYHVLDLQSGTLTQVNPSDKQIAYGAAAFSKDGEGIYFTSDEDSEFKNLFYYELSSGQKTNLTQDIRWDVGSMALSDDGRYLAFTVNEDGIDKLYMRNVQTDEKVELPQLPVGQMYGLSFSPDSKQFSLVLNAPTAPGDVYIMDMDSKSLTRWTQSEIGGLNPDHFIEPELIHYPTFDEVNGQPRKIPAFVYKPAGDGPHPVVIDIHGGPEAQERPYFSSLTQFWLNELGVAVIAPNVRGSAGYGKSYLKLDNDYKRENSVKDIGKLLDWIAQQPDLNKERVAVFGGSYGGYMVLSSMFNYNERIRCGVDIVGISNFVTFLKNTKEYRRNLRRVEYGDERDPEMAEFLQSISPTTNAHKITKPLFVAQGLNDPRVPASEAEQIVEKVRNNDVNVWYMLAKDEGHGFRKKTNRDFFYNAVTLFFEQYLLD